MHAGAQLGMFLLILFQIIMFNVRFGITRSIGGGGRMAEWLRYRTLNHEIVGSSPAKNKVFCV